MSIRAAAAVLPILLSACSTAPDSGAPFPEPPVPWVYQLTGYEDGGFAAIVEAEAEYAVIDLTQDGGHDYFTAAEVERLRGSGKRVFAYFSVGTVEVYRPEYAAVAEAGLVLNRWGEWPDEYFAAYWDRRWWDLAVRPRLDRAIEAGFDGVYLDVPNAYEEIDLGMAPGEDRESLALKMVELIEAVDRYAPPGFAVLPQNAPELREYPGYLAAIDGIGIEDLFFRSTGEPCEQDWCAENLEHARSVAAAGKLVLAVDYPRDPAGREAACERYAEEGFAGYVAEVALDAVRPPC